DSQLASSGDTILFSASASAPTPVSYQWQFNGRNLDGQTNATLTLANVGTNNAGSYRVIARAGGFVASAAALLSVDVPALILTDVADAVVIAGETATFSVEAIARSPLLYQWRVNGTDLPGATNPVLTLTNAQAEDAGLYSVVLTAAGQSLQSRTARLIVKTP